MPPSPSWLFVLFQKESKGDPTHSNIESSTISSLVCYQQWKAPFHKYKTHCTILLEKEVISNTFSSCDGFAVRSIHVIAEQDVKVGCKYPSIIANFTLEEPDMWNIGITAHFHSDRSDYPFFCPVHDSSDQSSEMVCIFISHEEMSSLLISCNSNRSAESAISTLPSILPFLFRLPLQWWK